MLTLITDNQMNRIDPHRVKQVVIFPDYGDSDGHIQIQEEIVTNEHNFENGMTETVRDHHYTNLPPVPNQDKALKKIIRLVEKKKKGTYRFTTKKKNLNKLMAKSVKRVQQKEQDRAKELVT